MPSVDVVPWLAGMIDDEIICSLGIDAQHDARVRGALTVSAMNRPDRRLVYHKSRRRSGLLISGWEFQAFLSATSTKSLPPWIAGDSSGFGLAGGEVDGRDRLDLH